MGTLYTYTPGSNLTDGTYWWRVNASNSGGTSSWSSTWTINIGSIPEIPILNAPADSAETTDTTPTFDWDDVSGATAYHLLIADDAGFSSIVVDESTADSYQTPASPLSIGRYWWKVRAENVFGNSSYSTSRTLLVYSSIPIDPPGIWPGSGLDWNDVPGAIGYNIYSTDDPYGSTFTFEAYVTESFYSITFAEPRKFYYVVAVFE